MGPPAGPVASSSYPRLVIDRIRNGCRYRVAETPNGFLITARTRDKNGLTTIRPVVAQDQRSRARLCRHRYGRGSGVAIDEYSGVRCRLARI
jgi:hypothetical protein